MLVFDEVLNSSFTKLAPVMFHRMLDQKVIIYWYLMKFGVLVHQACTDDVSQNVGWKLEALFDIFNHRQ